MLMSAQLTIWSDASRESWGRIARGKERGGGTVVSSGAETSFKCPGTDSCKISYPDFHQEHLAITSRLGENGIAGVIGDKYVPLDVI